ncbi:hypothetical protein CCB80_02300 [Armatimonadetes bacterium Uphvl-Ar1]|nr:hypothetical protein CCB80_02300 [Armatimonadetes bacterium Uphvl-Ar1]
MSGRVVIVGGGIMGLCSAFYLSEWGWEVTILERGKMGIMGQVGAIPVILFRVTLCLWQVQGFCGWGSS